MTHLRQSDNHGHDCECEACIASCRQAMRDYGAIQPDGIHTIPVPHGMSIEQAWECIARNVALADPEPEWANVEVKDGRLVRVIPPAEIDLLAELNDLYRRVAACNEHPRLQRDGYELVEHALSEAKRALHDALDDWPA